MIDPARTLNASPAFETHHYIPIVCQAIVLLAVFLINILTTCIVCNRRRRKRKHVTEDVILALFLTDVLSVLVPGVCGLLSFYAPSPLLGSLACSSYQASSVSFQLAYMILVTFACHERLTSLNTLTSLKSVTSPKAVTSYRVDYVTHSTSCRVAVVYAFALGVSCVPLLGLDPDRLGGQECVFHLVMVPVFPRERIFEVLLVTSAFVSVLTSGGMIVLLSTKLFRLKRELGAKSPETDSDDAEKTLRLKESVMVTSTASVHCLTWMTILVARLLHHVTIVPENMVTVYCCLATRVPGILSLFLYALTHSGYRRAYEQVLWSVSNCMCGCQSTHQQSLEIESLTSADQIECGGGHGEEGGGCGGEGIYTHQLLTYVGSLSSDDQQLDRVETTSDRRCSSGQSLFVIDADDLDDHVSWGHSFSVNPCDLDVIDSCQRTLLDRREGGQWAQEVTSDSCLSLLSDDLCNSSCSFEQ